MRKKADPLKKLPAEPLFKKVAATEKLPPIVDPAARAEQYKNYLNDRQADCWAEFIWNGSLKALANYLETGGTVDEYVRAAIIDGLRNGQRGNRGGKDSWRDYATHVMVNYIMAADGVSQTEACRRYANAENREHRAVELQYKRGEPTSDFIHPQKEDEGHEK
jgi:hypothetical protein